MTELLRFGLIGCGRVAPRHAESLAELPGAAAGRGGRRPRVAAPSVFAKQYGADPVHRLSAPADTGRHRRGQHLHAQRPARRRWRSRRCEAGKHVIVEKPMALSLTDADAMIACRADETGRKLCVVLQNRYNPPMQDLRRVVDSGRLGRLLLGNATVRWYRPQEYYEDELARHVGDGRRRADEPVHPPHRRAAMADGRGPRACSPTRPPWRIAWRPRIPASR